MDGKIIFVRTNKGEDEARSKTAHLSGDIKRTLLMVDGTATFAEIGKRVAPSLRNTLEEMLGSLEKGGFIQDKARVGNIPKMVVPPKMVAPVKKPAVDDGVDELDFTSAFRAPSPEELARQNIEAAKFKAQQEAEEARLRAEQEVARAREEAELAKQKALAEAKLREETERRAREEVAAARAKAEQEAARMRAELEAAKAKAEVDAKARAEAERRVREAAEAANLKVQQEAEEARLRAEQEVARAREEAELAKQKALDEAKLREEAEAARLKAQQESEAVRLKAGQDAAKVREGAEAVKSRSGTYPAARSTSATVLFFDVVGYTKLPVNKQIEIKKQFNQLVSDCLAVQGGDERIILDTGDGAAIGFMQHPEDALEVAMQFRQTVMANRHNDYPDLKVRIGIHLGPINVANDMNGRSNMVGDGINDAQRVMSFAGIDQIYISRSYYDFVSRLSDEYANLFQYRGALKDKHEREHPVYELVDAATAPVEEAALHQADAAAPAITLEPFSFVMPEAAAAPPIPSEPAPVAAYEEPEMPRQRDDDAELFKDIAQMNWEEETSKSVAAEPVTPQQMPSALSPPPPSHKETAAPVKTTPPKEAEKPAAQSRMPSAEEVTKLAETQAKAWAEAEQRGAEIAKAKAERVAQQQSHIPPAAKAAPVQRRKPLPWGKLAAGLFAAALVASFAIPPLLPMQGYATGIEHLLADRLQQPVHIGRLMGRLLPTPRLDMSDVSVGETRQLQAQQARVNFALSALFSSNKPVTGIELEGVQANGAALQQITAWMQKIAADPRYPVERIVLNQGKLEADGMQLSGIGGELSFNQGGRFAKAKLYAEGNKLALEINATAEDKMAVSVTLRGSALPLLPDWIFDDLTARGELSGDELVITDLDGRIRGGMLLGDARIGWRSGWHTQGSLTAKTIATQNISRALSGDMDGTVRFQMQSASLSMLADAAVVDGNFVVKKGVINSFDIIETARRHSRENLPGGRTHFDELSGELSFANGAYNFRQLKMNTGMLSATGALGITKQQLSGRITADLTRFPGMGTVALQLNGTPDNPTLRAAY